MTQRDRIPEPVEIDDFDDEGFDDDEECCWYCHGEGSWHDCMDDSCCSLRPRNNVICPECGGSGYL